jgi:hypothetical protein
MGAGAGATTASAGLLLPCSAMAVAQAGQAERTIIYVCVDSTSCLSSDERQSAAAVLERRA